MAKQKETKPGADAAEFYDEPAVNENPEDPPAPPTDDEPLVFSLVKKEKPFEIQTENGAVVTYKLVELDGAQRDQWMTAQAQKVKYSDKGTPAGVSSLMGVQASLLSLAVRDHTGQRVSEQAIQKWPASMLNRLFAVAHKMNGMDKDGADAAKKA